MGWVIGIGLTLLVGLFGYGMYLDDVQWQEFKTEHSCKVVGKMRGDVSTHTALAVAAT